jgi:hypothetical protein
LSRGSFVAKEEKVIKHYGQDLIVNQPYFKYLTKIQTILMDKHSSLFVQRVICCERRKSHIKLTAVANLIKLSNIELN